MLAAKASEKFIVRAIPSGWALDAILRLDEEHPGFHSFLCRASILRRQGVFLALSEVNWDRPEKVAALVRRGSDAHEAINSDPVAAIAHALVTTRVRDLVQAIFGEVANGFVGALARCGDDPLDELAYEILRGFFNDPNDKRRACMLRNVAQIDDRVIGVVSKLPDALLHPSVLQFVQRPGEVRQCHAAIKLIRSLHPHVSDQDLAASLGQLPANSSLPTWVQRWVEKSEKLPSALPYAGDDVLRPLVSAADFREAGRKYRNCLGSKVAAVALGRACYYEHQLGDGAIAEIEALSGGKWLLTGIYGPGNGRPASDAVRMIRTILEGAGVLVAAAHVQGAELGAVAAMIGQYEFSSMSSLGWDSPLLNVA